MTASTAGERRLALVALVESDLDICPEYLDHLLTLIMPDRTPAARRDAYVTAARAWQLLVSVEEGETAPAEVDCPTKTDAVGFCADRYQAALSAATAARTAA